MESKKCFSRYIFMSKFWKQIRNTLKVHTCSHDNGKLLISTRQQFVLFLRHCLFAIMLADTWKCVFRMLKAITIVIAVILLGSAMKGKYLFFNLLQYLSFAARRQETKSQEMHFICRNLKSSIKFSLTASLSYYNELLNIFMAVTYVSDLNHECTFIYN